MIRLSFKAGYVAPILSGAKTSTIRGRCRVQRGDRVAAICQYNHPPFAELEVTDVERLPVEAIIESWPSVRETYDQDHVYVIHFRRIGGDADAMGKDAGAPDRPHTKKTPRPA